MPKDAPKVTILPPQTYEDYQNKMREPPPPLSFMPGQTGFQSLSGIYNYGRRIGPRPSGGGSQQEGGRVPLPRPRGIREGEDDPTRRKEKGYTFPVLGELKSHTYDPINTMPFEPTGSPDEAPGRYAFGGGLPGLPKLPMKFPRYGAGFKGIQGFRHLQEGGFIDSD